MDEETFTTLINRERCVWYSISVEDFLILISMHGGMD
jgi:hypothetical protein